MTDETTQAETIQTQEVQSEVTDDLDQFAAEFFQKEDVKADKSTTEEPAKVEEAVAPADTDTVDEEADKTSDKDTDDTTDQDKTEAPEPPKKSRFQERIDQLSAKAREAEEREAKLAAQLQEAIAKLEAQAQTEKPKNPILSPTDPNEGPQSDETLDDGSLKYPLGEFDPAYIRDRTAHEIDRRWAEITRQQEEKAHADRLAAQQAAAQKEWNAKLEASTNTYPDMLDQTEKLYSTFANIEPQYGEYLAQTIMGLDKGPDVLYYLATHVDEAEKIAASGAIKATIALGRIEQMFVDKEKAAVEKQIRVSNAPPVAPQTKGSAASLPTPDDTDDLDAFAAKFFPQKRRR